jgi:Zn finger protein HypA/HybF involved in hydrogenase expression
MSANAGEAAEEGGEFRCAHCHEKVRVSKGDKIPKCPKCGNGTFDTRVRETSGPSAR